LDNLGGRGRGVRNPAGNRSRHAAPQRYEHLAAHAGGSTVRFTALNSGFTADLELDLDGVVVSYSGLARRARSALE
jgi:hypothetical protein